MGVNDNLEHAAGRACPRCHAFVDWRRSDPAFSSRAEYRICPECDEAIFIGWRTSDPSKSQAEDTR